MSDSKNEAYLSAVGGRIRELYIDEKSRLAGKRITVGRRQDTRTIWDKAAERCLSLKASPEAFVRACFQQCRTSVGPFPNMLGSAQAAKWFRQWASLYREDHKDEGETETETMDRQTLSASIQSAREAMVRLHGSYMPIPDNLAWLANYGTSVPATARILLGYPDDEIRKRHGADAFDAFARNPNLVVAAKRMGYPMDDILEWLQET